jgi:hypothetical protein
MATPFCTCGHSYWFHHLGLYDADGRRDYTYGQLRTVCEVVGCRCIDYDPKLD